LFGNRQLLVEKIQVIRLKFCAFGSLPFLPGYIESDRCRFRPGSRYVSVVRNKRRDFPAQAEIESIYGAPGGAACRDIEIIRQLGIGKDAGLEELRNGYTPMIANRAELRAGKHRQNGSLVGR
jgi:hypothetical protein